MIESTPSLAPPDSKVSITCTSCAHEIAEPGYSTLLCTTCRDRLARRPFPLLIKLSAFLIAVTSIFAFMRFEQSIHAGIYFSRGQHAERTGDYALAAQHYREVIALFPDSTLALSRLALAYYHADRWDEAADVFSQLSGRKVPRELASDIERAIRAINSERQWKQWKGNK